MTAGAQAGASETADAVHSVATAGAVFAELTGQEIAVDQLQRAVAASQAQGGDEASVSAGAAGLGTAGMTHAWLFTGPPGSGRSLAARAFAAALLCEWQGCGQCQSCHQVAGGTHADVLLVRPDGLSYGVR